MTRWRRVWTRSAIVLSLVLWISHLSGHASYARQVAAQAAASLESTSAAPPEQVPSQPLDIIPPPEIKRPPALTALYVSFAGLEALNAHSAFPTFEGRARQTNPVLAEFASSRAALVATKVGVTAATIYLSERLRKKNPKAVVWMMIGLNSALAVITAHNYRATGKL